MYLPLIFSVWSCFLFFGVYDLCIMIFRIDINVLMFLPQRLIAQATKFDNSIFVYVIWVHKIKYPPWLLFFYGIYQVQNKSKVP